MSTGIEYRVVIDERTDENIGVVKIDSTKWKGAHWIVDQDGDDRRRYKFRNIDASKYDTAIAFETHPTLAVKYKNYLHVFEDQVEFYWVILSVAASLAIACSYILGTVIMFSDLAPELGNSLWYQVGYWIITAGTIVAGLGMIASMVSEYVLGKDRTKKDILIKEWMEFKKESEENSAPDS